MVSYHCDRCHHETDKRFTLKPVHVRAGTEHRGRKWHREFCRDCFKIVSLAVETIMCESVNTETNGELFSEQVAPGDGAPE